jgi:hypothetical protein
MLVCPAHGLCAEPGLPHRHLHHRRRSAADFGLSAQSLGSFAGLFGLSFGVAQLLMGIGMDIYGLRRTVLLAFPLAIAGQRCRRCTQLWLADAGPVADRRGLRARLSGQHHVHLAPLSSRALCLLSGMGMGVGGLGLLFTGTPLAWLVQHWAGAPALGCWPCCRCCRGC